jgi:organic anion transporter 4A
LERRFRFTSNTSATISAAFNVGAVCLIFPFSYLAGTKNAPKLRYLALGIFIMGLGSTLYCLPHFISSLPKASSVSGDICSSSVGVKSADDDASKSDPPIYLLLVFGHFLHGAGEF